MEKENEMLKEALTKIANDYERPADMMKIHQTLMNAIKL